MPKNETSGARYTWGEYSRLVKVLCSVHESEGTDDKGLLLPGATARMTTMGLRAFEHPELEIIVPVECIKYGMDELNTWAKYVLDEEARLLPDQVIGGEVSALHTVLHRIEEQPNGLLRLVLRGTQVRVCGCCSEEHKHAHSN